MLRLIKTDLKRILKDKLFLVTLILAGIFAVITPVLYKIIAVTLGSIDEEMTEMLGMFVHTKDMFFSSFSLGNNFGLVLPIFIAIIICKDYSYGTIRNKIICGHSRTNIFLSIFISGAIVMCGVILVHALLSLGVGSLFFKYKDGAFTAKDFAYLLESVAFQLLVYVFISALICFLCSMCKNAGVCIVLYIAIMFASILLGTILSVGVDMSAFGEGNKTLARVLEFLLDSNVFTSNSSVIGRVDVYKAGDVLKLILAPTGFAALFVGLGILGFNKRDLK